MPKCLGAKVSREPPGFEAEAEAVAFETEAVDAEAARQYVNKQVTCEQ